MTRLPIEHGDTGALAREKINNSRTRLLQDIQEMQPKIINKTRWIGNTNTGISAEGKGLTLRVDEGKIQYQVEGGSVWVDLIEISALKGERGEPFRFEDFSPEQLLTLKGEQGKDGVSITAITKSKSGRTTTIIIHKSDRSHQSFTVEDGVGIENITNNSLNGVNTITIHKTDGSTHKFNIYDGADGEDGADGKNPEFNLGDNHIQWRLQGAEERINLIPLSLIQGAQGIQGPQGNKGDQGNPGKNPEFNLGQTHIQWRLQGESQRKNLIPLALITGPAGSGTGDMLKSENLAGLTDKQQARTNLEVYSKAEVDEQVNSSKHIEVNVETAWNVQHKVGTTAQGNYVPKKGDILLINFVHGTVIARPTLNIDGSGAKYIRAGYYDVSTNMLNLNRTPNSNIKVFLWYDGSHYQMFGAGHNSTYGEIPEAEIGDASKTHGRLISGRRIAKMKEHFEQHVPPPTAPNHSANKEYVDNKIDGIEFPQSETKESIKEKLGKAGYNSEGYLDVQQFRDAVPERYLTRIQSTDAEMSLVDRVGANRLALLPIEQVTIEVSTDGQEWEVFPMTDLQKMALFDNECAQDNHLSIPKNYTECRITLDSWRSEGSGAERYVQLTKLYMLTRTEGAHFSVQIDRATIGEPDTFIPYITHEQSGTFATRPGGVYINHPAITFGGGNNQTSNNRKLRIHLKKMSGNVHNRWGLGGIQWYGPNSYTNPSNLMRTGRPYKVGYDKSTLFEGKVQSVQAPTQNEDLTNKKYVDDSLTSKENASNKKTDIETNKTSDNFFPTIKAVYDWVVGKLNGLAKLNGGNEFVGKQIFFKTSSTSANPRTSINGATIELDSSGWDSFSYIKGKNGEIVMSNENGVDVTITDQGIKQELDYDRDPSTPALYAVLGTMANPIVIKPLTQQQYDTLPTKDPYTLYLVINV